MIKCHLSRMMGEKKVKVADVARATGLHRNTVSALYFERASRIELDAIDVLCRYFGCTVAELFEYQPEENVQ